jgi:hypothetical protein
MTQTGGPVDTKLEAPGHGQVISWVHQWEHEIINPSTNQRLSSFKFFLIYPSVHSFAGCIFAD